MERLIKCNAQLLEMYIENVIKRNYRYEVSEQSEYNDSDNISLNSEFGDIGNFTYLLERITVADGEYLVCAYFGGSWSSKMFYIEDSTYNELAMYVLETINNAPYRNSMYCLVRLGI